MSFFSNNRNSVKEVATLGADGKEALLQDKNKDGIPDYLQRENFASIINSNKDFLKWESDVETEIEQYIMGLKGYDYDVNNSLWKPVSPPLMNDSGINFIKTMLRTIINKHSINTYLSADDAHNICLYHTESLVKALKYRKDIYEINLADLNSIVISFDDFAYIILSRSVNDKQRGHNTSRLNMNYSSNNNEVRQ